MNLELTEAQYAEAFKVFRSKSVQTQTMLEWLVCYARTEIQPKKQLLSILSVGAGNGDFDIQFARRITNLYKSTIYSVIEPNQVLIEQFKQKTDTESFTFYNEKYENFKPRGKFDLILIVHSLYYFVDPLNVIQLSLDLLEEGGHLVIFNSASVGIAQLRNRLTGIIPGVAPQLESQTLRVGIELNNIPYQYEELQYKIDVTECFDSEISAGTTLLNFLLEINTLFLDPDQKKIARDVLYEIAEKQGDKIFLPHPCGVFTFTREIGNAIRENP